MFTPRVLSEPMLADATLYPVFFLIAVVIAIVRRSIRAGSTQVGRTTAVQRKIAPANTTPFYYPTHPTIIGDANVRPSTWPIESVRQLMGAAPRTFDPALSTYLNVVPPKWLTANPDDEQWINIKVQEKLRRIYPVVWGTCVQANNNLFKRNNLESGASVIYSPDPWFDRNPEALGEIASRCFELKSTDPEDPESAAFARMITNELTRGMRMKVPRIFTSGRKVYHSSMLMPRKHLPKGFLSGRFFPVWVDAQLSGAVVMVPAAYWPASLTADWDQG